MQEKPDRVMQGRPPTLKKATVEALSKDGELEALRQERVRFDGYFTGPTW